ncbi:peptidase family C50-domain-containing protein [Piptocephalis cylindrospora]|uniref:separase n=1 Tax=Piptocephalis cylindrospora TaxID=1907219 RepID=A0A4P9Y989_9FUNG|nr:peptidase family C50-domain-containing protein [Piptocephalis cylindrospora]|eukprot:RKP14570.1 peptidase family C50-domain-containing protein [Piptocephalis cylindrospora]
MSGNDLDFLLASKSLAHLYMDDHRPQEALQVLSYALDRGCPSVPANSLVREAKMAILAEKLICHEQLQDRKSFDILVGKMASELDEDTNQGAQFTYPAFHDMHITLTRYLLDQGHLQMGLHKSLIIVKSLLKELNVSELDSLLSKDKTCLFLGGSYLSNYLSRITSLIRACTIMVECYQRLGCSRESDYFAKRGTLLAEEWLPVIGPRTTFPMMLVASQGHFQRNSWEEGWESLCILEERTRRNEEAGSGGERFVSLRLARGSNLVRERRLTEAMKDLEGVLNFHPIQETPKNEDVSAARLSLGELTGTAVPPTFWIQALKQEAAYQWGLVQGRFQEATGEDQNVILIDPDEMIPPQDAFLKLLSNLELQCVEHSDTAKGAILHKTKNYMYYYTLAHLQLCNISAGKKLPGSILWMLEESAFPKSLNGHHRLGTALTETVIKCLEASKGLVEAFNRAKDMAHPELLQKIGYDLGWVEILYASLPVLNNGGPSQGVKAALRSLEAGKAPSLWRQLEGSTQKDRGLAKTLSSLCSQPSIRSDCASSSEIQSMQDWSVPDGWIVCSLSLDPERQDIYWSRLRGNQLYGAPSTPRADRMEDGCGGEDNVLLRLPLRRQALRRNVSRSEGEELEFTYDVARKELESILEESGETTAGMVPPASESVGVEGSLHGPPTMSREERARWWELRRALDERLRTLLNRIESLWIGGFKGLLTTPSPLCAQKLEGIEERILSILHQAIQTKTGRSKGSRNVRRSRDGDWDVRNISLSPLLLTSLINSAHDLGEADMDDVLYYLLDACTFQGMSIAYDELDLEELGKTIRTTLRSVTPRKNVNFNTDTPIILILDKYLQRFPWESIPCLRGRMVCRLPSMHLFQRHIGSQSSLSHWLESPSSPKYSRVIPTRDGYYVVNPAGDLRHTEKTFRPLLLSRSEWEGTIGRAPPAGRIAEMLKRPGLFLYFGHGGAESYVPETELRHLVCESAVLLIGCSSGRLHDAGDFDPYGIALDYLKAGW